MSFFEYLIAKERGKPARLQAKQKGSFFFARNGLNFLLYT